MEPGDKIRVRYHFFFFGCVCFGFVWGLSLVFLEEREMKMEMTNMEINRKCSLLKETVHPLIVTR